MSKIRIVAVITHKPTWSVLECESHKTTRKSFVETVQFAARQPDIYKVRIFKN